MSSARFICYSVSSLFGEIWGSTMGSSEVARYRRAEEIRLCPVSYHNHAAFTAMRVFSLSHCPSSQRRGTLQSISSDKFEIGKGFTVIISMSSLVITACRPRLYCNCKDPIMSSAFYVALHQL